MKIAFIADVHLGRSSYWNGVRRKLAEYAEQNMLDFVNHVSNSDEYAFAIQLGDLIQDISREKDLHNYKWGVELFGKCPIPVHHVIGNHDLIFLEADDLRKILGIESLYYSFDYDDFHFVILHSHAPVPRKPHPVILDHQLEWLQTDLKNTTKPSLVFSHYPLADQDMSTNYWFKDIPEYALVVNQQTIREILANSGKVRAVVNAHIHCNHICYHNGIPYISVQSAIENFNNNEIPSNAWGVIEITKDKFCLEVFGNDRMKFEHNFDQ